MVSALKRNGTHDWWQAPDPPKQTDTRAVEMKTVVWSSDSNDAELLSGTWATPPKKITAQELHKLMDEIEIMVAKVKQELGL